MINVYYDGKCGLCAREIKYYASIAPEGVFGWHDITKDSSGLEALNIDYVTGLKRLHAVDDQGDIHVGADAFILMWRELGKWKYLATFVALPGIRQIAGLLYGWFAGFRFSRLGHCQLALDDTKSARSVIKPGSQ